jgi:hypothetical protein
VLKRQKMVDRLCGKHTSDAIDFIHFRVCVKNLAEKYRRTAKLILVNQGSDLFRRGRKNRLSRGRPMAFPGFGGVGR